MTQRTYGHTASGKPIDDTVIDELADAAEAGFDVHLVKPVSEHDLFKAIASPGPSRAPKPATA